MATEFRPAVRDKTSCLIALAGASGSGKTFTAILMAMGLAYPGMSPNEIMDTIRREKRNRVVFIDSEGGRGKHYSPGPDQDPDFRDTFPYDYAEIRAPYSPENYQDRIVDADAAGYCVTIVDSMSHEYESEGGIQEIADEIEQGRLKPGKTMADTEGRDGWKAWDIKPVKSPGNWKEPKTRHKKMVNRAIQSRAHVIFCLRAEEKMLMKRVPKLNDDGSQREWNGKLQFETVVVPAEERPLLDRWAPICEKRFMYEMTVSFLLLPSAPGVGQPIKNLQSKFEPMFPPGEQLGVRNGQALAEWSAGRIDSGEIAPREQLSDPAGGLVQSPIEKARSWLASHVADLNGAADRASIAEICTHKSAVNALAKLEKEYPSLHAEAVEAKRAALERLDKADELAADHAADEQFPELNQ